MECGYQGLFDTQEVSVEKAKPDSFRYLGHNAFTGAMRYQCPGCNSYLNVNPMDIFKTYPVRGQPGPGQPVKDPYSISAEMDFLWQMPRVIKNRVLGLTRYISKNLGPIF